MVEIDVHIPRLIRTIYIHQLLKSNIFTVLNNQSRIYLIICDSYLTLI